MVTYAIRLWKNRSATSIERGLQKKKKKKAVLPVKVTPKSRVERVIVSLQQMFVSKGVVQWY